MSEKRRRPVIPYLNTVPSYIPSTPSPPSSPPPRSLSSFRIPKIKPSVPPTTLLFGSLETGALPQLPLSLPPSSNLDDVKLPTPSSLAQEIKTPRIVYRLTLESIEVSLSPAFKVSIQVHPFGTLQSRGLAHLELWGLNDQIGDKTPTIINEIELDSSQLTFLSDLSILFDGKHVLNNNLYVKKQSTGINLHLIPNLRYIEETDATDNIDLKNTRSKRKKAEKRFEMSFKAFAELIDVIPTLKFMINAIEVGDKIPTLKLCTASLTQMVTEREYHRNSKVYPISKYFEIARPSVLSQLLQVASILLIPKDAVLYVMNSFYGTLFIFDPPCSFKRTLVYILEDNELE